MPAAGGIQKSRFVSSLGWSSREENEKDLLPGNVAGLLVTSLKIPILEGSIGSSRRGYLLN